MSDLSSSSSISVSSVTPFASLAMQVVVGALQCSFADLQIHRLSAKACHFTRVAFPRAREILVVEYDSAADVLAFKERIQPLLRSRKRWALEVVVISDAPEEAFLCLEDIFQSVFMKKAVLTVVDKRAFGAEVFTKNSASEEGENLTVFKPIFAQRGRSALKKPLKELLDFSKAAKHQNKFLDMAEKSVGEQQERQAQGLAARDLFSKMSQQKTIVTWSLTAFLGVIFLLGMAMSGSLDAEGDTALLVRMGAIVPSSHPLSIQSWRLFTAPLLHAGILHLLSNLFVLYVLGRPLEQLLGSVRFLVLILASMLGGSLLSFTLNDAVSVGASGGIWGLLVAFFVLGLKKTSLLPESVRKSWRRTAVLNLALNLSVSFLPLVDKWAHFGGGLIAFFLLGSGALLWGLDEPAASEPHWRVALVHGMLAAGLALAFLGSLALAWRYGQPWNLKNPSFKERAVTQPCVLLSAASVDEKDKGSFVAGDPLWDSFIVEMQERSALILPQDKMGREEILRSLPEPPAYLERLEQPHFTKEGYLERSFRSKYNSHLRGRETLISSGSTSMSRRVTTLCNTHFLPCDGVRHAQIVQRLVQSCALKSVE